MKLKYYPPWSMNAWNYWELLPFTPRTLIIQPKLNGIRARWHNVTQVFISRAGLVIPEHIVPHLYEDMRMQNHKLPASLDGELYTDKLSFQDICGVLAQNRIEAHPLAHLIKYVPFDIITSDRAEYRQNILHSIITLKPMCALYKGYCDEDTIAGHLSLALGNHYEGIMLREPHAPYVEGRTRNLIKVKKQLLSTVKILSIIPGTGKFTDMAGALLVKSLSLKKPFKVGGGNITTSDRRYIFQQKHKIIDKWITIGYSETSKSGTPLKAQIVNRHEFYSE